MTDSYPNGFDKNKYKKILAIIDSNKFGHKNKIGKFKYIDIKDLVNNIRNNTISEISAKEGFNTLNKIKNAEIIKYKKCTPGQRELLNLFSNLFDTILTNKTLKSESQEDANEDENENDETLMSSKDDDDDNNKNDKASMSSDEDDETMSQNEKIKDLNDFLDEIIGKLKSFEEQTKSLKKLKSLKGYQPYKHFGDEELKFKYFEIELADISNEIDEKLFKQIFGHTLETLANKLINTKTKKKIK